MSNDILAKMAAALAALQDKTPNDIVGAETTSQRLCKLWLKRELFPSDTLDLETTEEYAAAYLATHGEQAVQELIKDRAPIQAARRLLQAIAYEETAGDRERAKKAKKDATKAAMHYCYMNRNGKGAFTAYKNALNAAMPELDAEFEWQGEDEEMVNEYVLNLHGV